MIIRHVLRGRCNPQNADGIIRHTYYLAHAQRRLGHDVEVYGIESNAVEPEVLSRDGLTVRAFPKTRNPFGVHPALAEHLSSSDGNADIFHLQPPHDPAVYGLGRMLWRRRRPYMLTAHAMWSPTALARHAIRKRLYKALFDDRLVRGSVGVHATAAAEVEEIRAYAPDVAVFVVRNSVDLGVIDSKARDDGPGWKPYFPDMPEDASIFTFLGRLDPYQKGLDVLLDTWALVSTQAPDKAFLALIGPFWRESEAFLRTRIEALDLHESVALVGPLYGDSKYTALRSSDCYIQTSRYESSPYTIQEALACSIPAILTPATNLADVVERYGAGVSVALDPEVIAAAILDLCRMERSDRKEMGRRGRLLVKERHSLALAARRMVEAYEAALNGSDFVGDD